MKDVHEGLRNDVRHEQPECGDGENPCAAVAFAKVTPPASGKRGEETHCSGHHHLESGRACLDCGICPTWRGRGAASDLDITVCSDI